MTVDEAKKVLQGLKGQQTSSISKNDIFVSLLKNLFSKGASGQEDPMHITELRAKFEDQFGMILSDKPQTFITIVGLPIDLFLTKNNSKFRMYEKDKRMIVVPIQSSRKYRHSVRTSGEFSGNTTGDDWYSDAVSEMISDTEYYSSSACNFPTDKDDRKTSRESTTSSEESDSRFSVNDKPKRKQKSMKHRRKHVSLTEEQQELDRTSLQNSDSISTKNLMFLSLIEQKENEDLKFCPSVEDYLDDPKEFIMDIASMWNSPYKLKSYIVLGVSANKESPHCLVGINQTVSNERLDEMFSPQCYSGVKPKFTYHKVLHQGKDFGIIEVHSSFGQGQPCIVSFPSKEQTYGDLLVRYGKSRRICSMNDPMTNSVFQWFMQKAGEAKGKNDDTKKRIDTNPPKQTKSVHTSTTQTQARFTDPSSTTGHFSSAVNNFKTGHYVLVAGNVPKGMQHATAISLVPWVAVYDFDIGSRDHGLLNSNLDSIKRQRSFHLTSWRSLCATITESSTIWNFPLGRRDDPASRVMKERDVKHWYTQTKEGIENTLEQLGKFANDYTVLTLVIFWPEDENLAPFMHKFIERLDDKLYPSPRIVLCLPKEPVHEQGKSVLSMMRNYHKDNMITIQMPLTDVCAGIAKILKCKENIQATIQYKLPVYNSNGDSTCCIDQVEAVWLQEHLEVLYVTNTYSNTKVAELKYESDNFYRGGTLHWSAWYECGSGFFDVERDQMLGIISQINGVLVANRAGFFTLFHAPGSGGTTLGQRLLWEFHKQTPCVHVKIKASLSLCDIVERINMLYEKTRCPVLLLVDGEDELKVKHLFQMFRSRYTMAVILYVKRFAQKTTMQVTNSTSSWLKGAVSVREAKKLTLKFSERCYGDHGKIATLERLCKDVEEQNAHCMYEFGLTTYLHEFKGITSYVRGYLDLEANEMNCLTEWQKMLGYLSLVYFYGHSSLSCQFFASLLHLPSNQDVTLADFPNPVEAFVVPDDLDGRKNNIRICHYLVAKEILEQILSRHTGIPQERGENLGSRTREHLAAFCKCFIDYCGRKKVKTCLSSHSIVHVLARTFIYRDSKDVSESADQIRKKPTLSKLLTDIPSQAPLHEERFSVLEKLTLAFPDDANFHAHLGRFCANCRPDQDDQVERHFQKALQLCEERLKNQNKDDIDERLKMTLSHIYHLYGTVLQKRIARYTGQAPTDTPRKATDGENFVERLEELLATAETACSYFTECRKYTPYGQENCLGYIGEITVRLQICDYVHKHFHDESFEGISGFLSPDYQRSIPGRKFVLHSIAIIDSLLMECYKFVDHEDMDHSIQKVLIWYHALFQSKTSDLEAIVTGDDVFAHRLRIAARKLKHGSKKSSMYLLEDVTSPDDVSSIVLMYEKIFEEISRTGIQGSKRALEMDYIEWLYAIRHPRFTKDYRLEEVLSALRHWNDYLTSPMAKFYLFVVTSLLGFGDGNTSGRTDHLSEAQILKEETSQMGKFVLKPKYPREWLGVNGKGIKRLIPGTRFLGLNTEERDMKAMNEDLLLCKGSICAPNNKKTSGYISLDLGDNTVPVRVFYVPSVANMATTRYANERVQFVLAFSLDHGYEAFNVRLLKRYACTSQKCSLHIEVMDDESWAVCPSCGNKVYKTAAAIMSETQV